MAEFRFYHLTRRTLEEALPQLLEKCLERGWRAVVQAASQERAEALSQHLWTYGRDSFLPHGTAKDGHADRQPVWITDRAENPNGGDVLFTTEGVVAEHGSQWRLVCDLFDGRDDEAVAAARERWRKYREAGHSLTYWQQSEDGRWSERAKAGGA